MTTMAETQSIQRASELPEAVAAALLSWTLALADTKHRIGFRTSEWINGTPALEGAVGAAALTQDELGHARSLYSLLRDFPGAPEAIGFENDLEARDQFYAPHALETRWSSWLDVIACNVLLDRALQVAIEAAAESSYAPLRGRVGKILQEEAFHRVFGDRWLVRLAARRDRVTERLQGSLNHFGALAWGWLGPDGDEVTAALHEAGILRANTAEMRQRWLEQAAPLCAKNGLSLPNEETIAWKNWNSRRREIL